MATNKYSAKNERIKRQYFTYLKEAKRHSESTIDAVAKAISRFEDYSQYRDFKQFHIKQAVAFKQQLAKQKAVQSGKPLSKATLYSTLTHLKRFFEWLAGQPGYKSRIAYADAEYFNLSEKETRIATARREKPVPALEQIKHIISLMPSNTDIEKRNRALIAFTILTGARDSAIASMKLKHVDLDNRCIYQDAREVKTKFSKSFITYFFPVGTDIEKIFIDWVSELMEKFNFNPNIPLFPATNVMVSAESNQFKVIGLKPEHWSNASPIRSVFKNACVAADINYFNPHSFRNTLVMLGEKICKTPEEFKAWSQNLGHEKVMTTFNCYGEVRKIRQKEILSTLSLSDIGASNKNISELLEAVVSKMRETY